MSANVPVPHNQTVYFHVDRPGWLGINIPDGFVTRLPFLKKFFWAHIGGDGFQRKPSVKGERGRVSCWEH